MEKQREGKSQHHGKSILFGKVVRIRLVGGVFRGRGGGGGGGVGVDLNLRSLDLQLKHSTSELRLRPREGVCLYGT